jgi:hypothetical protein
MPVNVATTTPKMAPNGGRTNTEAAELELAVDVDVDVEVLVVL